MDWEIQKSDLLKRGKDRMGIVNELKGGF